MTDPITALFGIDAVIAVALTTVLVKLFATDTGKQLKELAQSYMELRAKLEAYIQMGKDGYSSAEVKAIREGIQEILNRGQA